MKTLMFCFLAMALVQSPCFADATKLNPKIRQALLDAARFHEVRSRAELPGGVVAFLGSGGVGIADPGESWQIGCVGDDSTPKTLLIWAAIAGELCVVHYESGGIVHSFHILVATFQKGDTRATVEWSSVTKPFKDYGEFAAALQTSMLEAR